MLRKILFWTHLSLGLVAGLAIAIMSFTGAALAFEKELIAWAERDARIVEPNPANGRRSLDELITALRAARPEARVSSIALSRDPRAAVAFGLPGNVVLYANPYTGDIREAHAPRIRAFMRAMQAWHIRLNFRAGPGNAGRIINAAANAVFLLLCISGLVLWWPRAWNFRTLRPSLWFVRARGRARDWNWHNVIGFWCLPVLVILVGSGVVISYRWAGDLVLWLAGDTASAPAATSPGRPPAPGAGPKVSAPAVSPPLSAVLTRVEQEVPAWRQITLRFNPPPGAGSAPTGALNATVRAADTWPRFAVTTLTLDAQSLALRRTETFASLSAGQRARRWLRLLHTGEAFGWPGQLAAGIGCLGGCMLVWTGIALAWRRFFGHA